MKGQGWWPEADMNVGGAPALRSDPPHLPTLPHTQRPSPPPLTTSCAVSGAAWSGNARHEGAACRLVRVSSGRVGSA